ncbi:hypothetical protein F6W70_13750 [Microbacterium maritypicum]|uniref:Uncharacterized protein n=1 Tax=Microbacterium maritypicum TaxID=33918 RepID=A0AAD3X1M3_MICMQ|nr:hypothetical protein [Microbacterium liquefaciens]KAB1883656.1 hypothetical protein F6W70_13750 [Microbacterium liquefaciens]
MIPTTPPPAGSPNLTFRGANITYIWRTINDSEWIVEGAPGVETYITRSANVAGAFDVVQTNGPSGAPSTVSEWSGLNDFFR